MKVPSVKAQKPLLFGRERLSCRSFWSVYYKFAIVQKVHALQVNVKVRRYSKMPLPFSAKRLNEPNTNKNVFQ